MSRSIDGRTIVDAVSFAVPEGAAFGLLGPNGSGKTTTVRLLTGLLTPTAGSVAIFGEPLTPASADRLRQRIGVQTDTNLYEMLSVHDNLAIWADLFGIPKPQQRERIAEVLDVFNLADRDQSPVGTLSKGMRQKLAVARAILHHPDLLFLDEPTAGLDPEASEDLIEYLRAMIARTRTTVVICTHQLFGLERLCTDVGFLDRGRLIVSGKVDDLINRAWPKARFTIDVGDHVADAQAVLPMAGTQAEGRLTVDLDDPDEISGVITRLVEAGIPLRSVVPIVPTIHDLYFETIRPGKAEA